MKAVFIDRDGVINKDPGGWTEHSYVTSWSDFHFLPGALEALRVLKEKGVKVIVISNQAGVSKGYFTRQMLDDVSTRMAEEVERSGGRLDAVYYCTHRNEDNCDCRKPKTGLLEKAAREHGVDPAGVFFIGDSLTDTLAARKAGCRPVLVLSGKASREEAQGWPEKPERVFSDLSEAVKCLFPKTKRKVLIIYATAGIGHKKAATAVKKEFDSMALEDVEVSLVDALDYTSKFFKWSYLKTYLVMVNSLPAIWGFFYYLTDNFYVNLIVSRIRRLSNLINSAGLIRFLCDTRPDVIISTHFFASEIISDLRKRGILASRLMTVVTDYRLHSWWVSRFTDIYVVASRHTQDDLLEWDIPADRIKVLGIPVEPVFSKKLDREEIRGRLGLEKSVFSVLVIGGGFGVGPIEEVVRTAVGAAERLQILVICGHNEGLRKAIGAIKPHPGVRIYPFGFMDNVYEFMAVSDVLISKSGGITVSEALAKELPIIVIFPIPGQETWNCDYLVERGAAVKVERLADLRRALEEMIADPARLERMRSSIREIKRPDASRDIANLALQI